VALGRAEGDSFSTDVHVAVGKEEKYRRINVKRDGPKLALIDPISMVIEIGDDHFFISGP